MTTPGLSPALFMGAMAFAILASPQTSGAAEKVGSAVDISTRVQGQSGVLSKGDSIYRDETIRSNASGVGAFVFIDGTKLAVGPNSSVVIDEYVFGGGGTVKKLAIGATKGTLRWISGKSDHKAYRLQTPSGTLGVRGTAFDIYIGPDGVTAVTLLSGAADFCNSGGCRTLRRRCDFIIARPRGDITRPKGIVRNIGIKVNGSDAFPFLSGKAGLPRGFDVNSTCAGLSGISPDTSNGNSGGVFNPPAPKKDNRGGDEPGTDGPKN